MLEMEEDRHPVRNCQSVGWVSEEISPSCSFWSKGELHIVGCSQTPSTRHLRRPTVRSTISDAHVHRLKQSFLPAVIAGEAEKTKQAFPTQW
jgi:hypothetical protein